jgi:hypothetical protein
MAPQELQLPGTRPTERMPTVDAIESSAPAHPSSDDQKPKKPDDTIEAHYASMERLEDRYRHELMDDDERQRLRDEIKRLRG